MPYCNICKKDETQTTFSIERRICIRCIRIYKSKPKKKAERTKHDNIPPAESLV